MPVIKRTVSAAAENAVQGLRFATLKGPALVSLFASTETAGETVTCGVGDLSVLENAVMNVQTTVGVVDTGKDQLLFREPMAAGQIVLAVPAVAATVTFELLIEALT